jgi:hypothetical protein
MPIELNNAEEIKEINLLHERVCLSADSALKYAIRIGELLTKAKEALAHGEWGPWLAEHITFSPDIGIDAASTANS